MVGCIECSILYLLLLQMVKCDTETTSITTTKEVTDSFTSRTADTESENSKIAEKTELIKNLGSTK